MKFSACLLALLFLSFTLPAHAPASTPGGMPVIKADPEAAKSQKRQKSGFSCHIKGRVFCSEYGTRYKEPVVIVFTDGEERYPVPLGEVDGSFQADLPANSSYTMRLEFQGKGYEIGRLDIPELKGPGCSRSVEVYHPGSMLELVWEIRDDGRVNVGVKIREDAP